MARCARFETVMFLCEENLGEAAEATGLSRVLRVCRALASGAINPGHSPENSSSGFRQDVFVQHVLTGTLLALIVAVAAGLRLTGIDWDQGHHLHPDERFLSILLTNIRPAPDLGTYFDPTLSPLNPFNHGINFFVYGTFPIFVVEQIAVLLGKDGYNHTYLVGRVISAIFDVGTVLLVFLIGRRYLGIWPGLIAAALMAFSVHSIQIAHFFAVDTFATFFATLTIWFMCRYADLRLSRDLGLAGIATGLALASKLSAGLLLVLFAAWWIHAGFRDGFFLGRRSSRTLWVLHLIVYVVFASLVFRIFQPYAFATGSVLDWRVSPDFLSALAQQQGIQAGSVDWPPGIQWAGTGAWIYPLEQMLRWGLGPIFGIVAFGSVALAVGRWWRTGSHELAIPLIWAAINVVIFGALVLKTMRYLHSIYPMLALVTAWALASLWRRQYFSGNWYRRYTQRFCQAATFVVIAGTAFWALAFVQIYGREHSRIAASRFVYDHVPPGASIAVEHWDDALPLNVSGRGRDQYVIRELRVFDRDTDAKRHHLVEVLKNSDYVILSSRRGSRSIPRLPQRYPMTAQYYAALDDGSLGFDELARFDSFPSLGPFSFDDRAAEEAFSVYDHPTVVVYERQEKLGALGMLSDRLASMDVRGAVQVLPRDATTRRTTLTETEQSSVELTSGWPRQLLDRPLGTTQSIVVWFLATWVTGVLIWPLLWLALRHLPDRGYTVARVLGPAVVVMPAWWLSSLGVARFDVPAIVVGISLVAVVSVIVLWFRGPKFWHSISTSVRSLVVIELLALSTFGLMLLIRASNPDLWHPVFGGEKPMDYAHLNSVIRSVQFPPHDPWYAGSKLNYYYFGHVPTAALVKTLGVLPSVAYNLAIASAFSAAAIAIFAVASSFWIHLKRSWREAALVGVVAVGLVLLAGNLQILLQVVSMAQREAGISGVAAMEIPGVVFGGRLAHDFDFWAPTRVIAGTVNEFPWFTFLYGDLHPHLMNYANTGVALVGVVGIVALGERARRDRLVGRTSWIIALAPVVLVLAIHRVTNPWDFPAYALIAVSGFAYALWRSRSIRSSQEMVLAIAGAAILVFVGSRMIFWPFHETYVGYYGGVVPTPETTSAANWLLIFGLPIAVLVTHVMNVLFGRRVECAAPPISVAERALLTIAAVMILFSLVASGDDWSARILMVGLVMAGGVAAWRVRESPLDLAPVALFLAGVLLTSIPEFVAVRDDIGRLNTVFKLYLQAWTLLGLGAAFALPSLVRCFTAGGATPLIWARRLWVGAVGLLAVAAVLYPVLSTPHKVGLRIQQTERTLDGEAYLRGGFIVDQGHEACEVGGDQASSSGVPISLDADHRAIEWIRKNVNGSPTLAETPTTIYRWGGRISAHTGLPTLVAWDWHAKQQHWGNVHQIEARFDDTCELFATLDPWRARTLLSMLNVRLLYVGELERALYEPDAIEKFERMRSMGVRSIYRDGDTVLYRIDAEFSPPVG